MVAIDFVITWVDQSDPKWLAKYQKVTGSPKMTEEERARYRDYGTLRYLFRSIERYAPWVHHVYLVTDEQVPAWLDDQYSKLTVVDHKEIISDSYLPTFNSNVIDLNLINIPNLEEHFVYFNDDMFLNKRVEPNDFFDESGKPKDFLSFNAIMPNGVFEHTYVNNLAILNNQFSKKQVLRNQFGRIFNPKNGKWNLLNLATLPFPLFTRFVDPHTPVSYCRSRVVAEMKKFPQIERVTSKNRQRATSDYSLWFFRYYDLLTGYYSHRAASFSYAHQLKNWPHAVRDIQRSKHAIININDSDDIDDGQYEEATAAIREAFDHELGERSHFER